jgi:predicted transcriptional regulator
MSRTLMLQLDDDTYQLFDKAAKAENRSLTSFIETSVLSRLRDQRVDDGPSELQQAVAEAERGIAQGRWVEHSKVAARLKQWAAGEP